MTAAVQALLDSFDALSEAERHEAAVELLHRVKHAAAALELSDEALVTVADEVFRELDASEATGPDVAEVESAWDAEASRRVTEIRSGSAAGRPVDDLLAELRER